MSSAIQERDQVVAAVAEPAGGVDDIEGDPVPRPQVRRPNRTRGGSLSSSTAAQPSSRPAAIRA